MAGVEHGPEIGPSLRQDVMDGGVDLTPGDANAHRGVPGCDGRVVGTDEAIDEPFLWFLGQDSGPA